MKSNNYTVRITNNNVKLFIINIILTLNDSILINYYTNYTDINRIILVYTIRDSIF